jgi:hypothetical protein
MRLSDPLSSIGLIRPRSAARYEFLMEAQSTWTTLRSSRSSDILDEPLLLACSGKDGEIPNGTWREAKV